jgi:hypothetical protein
MVELDSYGYLSMGMLERIIITINKKIMKRYIVEMNDGEFLKDFHQLKDAKAYRAKENFNYISRYVRIYDRKKGHYIC